jgi:anti-anti-sigma regulatory factor
MSVLRITERIDGRGLRIRVEGRAAGPQAGELLRAVRHAREAAGRIVLDMSGVTFVDRGGLEVLLRLRRQNTAFDACSRFVSILLGEAQ